MKALFFFFLLTFSTVGFSQTNQTYEYMSMTQSYNSIKLNKNSESFEIIDIRKEMIEKSNLDFSPLLKRIQEYEEQGWEFVTNNVFCEGNESSPQNYVLMRRKK